jgi:hypothetical protein
MPGHTYSSVIGLNHRHPSCLNLEYNRGWFRKMSTNVKNPFSFGQLRALSLKYLPACPAAVKKIFMRRAYPVFMSMVSLQFRSNRSSKTKSRQNDSLWRLGGPGTAFFQRPLVPLLCVPGFTLVCSGQSSCKTLCSMIRKVRAERCDAGHIL